MKNGKNSVKSAGKKKIGAIITDTHVKDGNEELVEFIFDQLFEKMVVEGVELLFHAGDWFNSRKGQSLNVLKSSLSIVDSLNKEIETFIVPGNHDKVDLESEDSFIDVLEKPNFNIVKNVSVVFTNEKINVVMIPYFKENGRYQEELSVAVDNDIEKGKINVLITHIAVNGVKNNDGSEVENNLDKNLFKSFDYVYVGHYHNRSKVGHVEYIGSAYQANFGEDDEKGFCWLYDDGSVEFEKLQFPLFRKYELDVDQVTPQVLQELKQMKSEAQQDNIRLIIKGDSSKVKAFDKNILNEAGIEVSTRPDDIDKNMQDAEAGQISFFNRDLILESFKKFCKENNIEDSKFGIEKLEKCLV